MKVGDLVILVELGEIKAYKANPKTPEAEAGLKPEEVKLDLVRDIDIADAHKKIQDLITDTTGTVYKAGFLSRAASGEKHTLKESVLNEIIKVVAEDIDLVINEENPKKVFIAIPKEYANKILDKVKNKDKIFRVVEKNLLKEDKNTLMEKFKPFA